MNQIDYLKIFTISIAILTAWVAYNQYRINKYKVKYDLYDRRNKVFELCQELLDRIITKRDLDINGHFTNFIRIRYEGYFLFDEKIAQQIEYYYKIGFYYREIISLDKGHIGRTVFFNLQVKHKFIDRFFNSKIIILRKLSYGDAPVTYRYVRSLSYTCRDLSGRYR